ncbi:MAG: FAD-binding protein [Actinomycetota bacterium]
MTVITGPFPVSVRPVTLGEARDAVTGEGALLFRGGGTKLDWGATPVRVDRVIDTTGLEGIKEWNAADMTATVQAGMPLARLQNELAAAGQWLAVDPPLGEGESVTVGGVFAANDSGPRRLRFGPIRDLVIGLVIVLADGTVARCGGKVIKNVAGYDVAKLFCGSLGTLGLVAEITVRLHPRPEAGATVRVTADAGAAPGLLADIQAAPLEPVALDWAQDALWVRFQGRAAGVEAQATLVRRLADRLGFAAEELRGHAEDAAWRALVDGLAGIPGETVVRGSTLPDRFGPAAEALRVAGEEAGVQATLHSHVGLGLHTVRLSGGDAPAHARAVAVWRRRLADIGGYAVVRRRVPGVEEAVAVFGPDPSGGEIMRRVKSLFDPRNRCAPGRFGRW